MTTGHPLYEEVNQALIGIVTDSTVRKNLGSTWLHVPRTEEAGLDLLVFGRWLWIPAAAVVVLCTLAVVFVASMVGRVEKAARNSLTDKARASAREAKMAKGRAGIVLQPADQLVHQMAFDLRDVTDLMHELRDAVCESAPGPNQRL